MKKLLFWALVLGTLLFIVFADRPMQLFLNFVVGGVVPGINISLGFLPSLLIIIAIALTIRSWAKSIHEQMIQRAADLNKVASNARDFAEKNSGETIKNSAVIAAPETKTN